ncbi:phage tail protein [Lacticaseibacillus paracasei]|uniref:distal tail protein Dit n=1 Tax=Lacticaseibacillus paracasei TaxID=1597 RepID=UPI0023590AD6|nr:distal tail protein Dit [Lacticaseibacillus paracasei]WCZ19979.1 phage tail protein [Lacticaseibacillus paracasei]
MTMVITFNDINISKWIDGILLVTRNVGQNRVPQLDQVGRSDGKMFSYIRADEGTITVTAIVRNDVNKKRRLLADALTTSAPAKLIFADEPDIYYNAISTGQITLDEAYLHNTLTITFTVPDGIAHSVATQTFDNKDPKWNGSPLNLLTGTSNQETSGTVDLNNWNAPSQHPNISVTPGQKFAYQIFITNDNTVDLTAGIDAFSGTAWKATYVGNIIKAGTSGYSSVTFTIPSGADNIVANAARLVTRVPNAKTTVYWQEEKLSAGTTVSPWSPNPADPEYYTNTITVHNGGTYPVEPVITATMHADNGLIALINSQGGVLQFGNPEEADGVVRQRSEVARYEGFDKEPAGAAYNTGQTNSHYYYIAAQKNVMEGSVKYADDDGSAVEPVFLPTNSYYWEGPSVHLKTTNASNGSNTGSFIAKWRYKFNSSVNALGAIEMTLDNDVGVAYQVIIRANYAGKDDVDVQVFAGSTLVFQQTLNRSVFSNGRYYEAKLTKLGNTLNLQLAGIVQGGITPSQIITRNPPLIMPPITLTSAQASIPITGTTLWFQRFENYPYPDMGVYDMDIEWLNVNYWADLKNRFGAGDVVTIDVANRQILVNGVINTNLQMIDNDWNKFKLAPGDTLVFDKCSYWAQPYETEIELREAFL